MRRPASADFLKFKTASQATASAPATQPRRPSPASGWRAFWWPPLSPAPFPAGGKGRKAPPQQPRSLAASQPRRRAAPRRGDTRRQPQAAPQHERGRPVI